VTITRPWSSSTQTLCTWGRAASDRRETLVQRGLVGGERRSVAVAEKVLDVRDHELARLQHLLRVLLRDRRGAVDALPGDIERLAVVDPRPMRRRPAPARARSRRAARAASASVPRRARGRG
jgi:hypothetical protein